MFTYPTTYFSKDFKEQPFEEKIIFNWNASVLSSLSISEGIVNSVQDISLNTKNASTSNGPTLLQASGVLNNSYYFDFNGIDNFLSTANAGNLPSAKTSVFIIGKFDELSSGNQNLLHHWNNQNGYTVETTGANNAYYVTNNVLYPINLSPNTWYLFSYNVTSSGTYTYLNNVETGNSTLTAINPPNVPLYLGRRSESSSGYLNGGISIVTLYDNLTLSEHSEVREWFLNRYNL